MRSTRILCAILTLAALPSVAAAQQLGYGLIWSRVPGADHMRILAIAPGSPAAGAGLAEDDQVVAIRGKRVASIPQGQEEQTAGPPTTPLVLRVRRSGAESDLSLSAAPVRQDVLESRLRTRFCSRGDCTNGPGKISIPGMFDYEGRFATGAFDGDGAITLPAGITCSGSFIRGGLSRGRCTLPDGVVYDGELKDYTPAGRGNLISKNGLRVEGTWSGLRATGEVRAVYPDGWVYRGPFTTPNEPNRPTGSYFDASGNKVGEAPLLEPHPTVNTRTPTEITSRQLFENGKGDVIAKLRREFPNARILYEQHVEAETRYLTIPLGRPNPGSARTVIIALMGDSRQVSDVGIVRPGSTTVQWGGNVISTLQVTSEVFASNSLYGQVRAKSGVTTANLYVIVMAQ